MSITSTQTGFFRPGLEVGSKEVMDKMMTRLGELEIEPDYILEKPFSEKDILFILKENFPKHEFKAVIERQ